MRPFATCATTSEEHIRQVVDQAPGLTPEQADRLAALLHGGRQHDRNNGRPAGILPADTMIDAACELGVGWLADLPARASRATGKARLTQHRHLGATMDRELIKAWWRRRVRVDRHPVASGHRPEGPGYTDPS
jgi:hypothetical protein